MRLKAYLTQENINPREFGERMAPGKRRITVYQWAEGTRFPRDPADLQAIENASCGQVTAADFVAHALELRNKPATEQAA